MFAANTGLPMSNSKTICYRCVGETFFSAEISRCGTESECSYCGNRAIAFSIDEVANRVATAFEEHFRRTSTDPDFYESLALSDKESNYDWSRHGAPVVDAIAAEAGIPESAASDIQQELEERYSDHDDIEETEFDSQSHYEEQEADGDHWRRQWLDFERAIKTQTRFFGHHAEELLTNIFSKLQHVSAASHRPLVTDIGPGFPSAALYRARVFQSKAPLRAALCRPDRGLGPPPGHKAPAGRMNAHGISVFYGATESEVAIAEIRPPVGTRVAVARFEITRPLRILNLGNLASASAAGSIFDEAFADLCQQAAFLRSLSKMLCAPVVPNDEDLEYLPTQAIADFLATERDPPLDGIAYPSTQIDGTGYNVVLFHKAARVEELQLPEDAEIDARTRSRDADGWYTEYHVTETLGSRHPEAGRSLARYRHEEDPSWSDYEDHREPSLRVAPECLTVHEVNQVNVSTDRHTVSRSRQHVRHSKTCKGVIHV